MNTLLKNSAAAARPLLSRPEVLAWIHGQSPSVRSRAAEQELARDLGIDCAKNQQWTGAFGEQIVREALEAQGHRVRRPQHRRGLQPDWMTDYALYEVKTQLYSGSGSAADLVYAAPVKYGDMPRVWGRPLNIVLLGRAEDRYRGLLSGPRGSFLMSFIELCRAHDIYFVSGRALVGSARSNKVLLFLGKGLQQRPRECLCHLL